MLSLRRPTRQRELRLILLLEQTPAANTHTQTIVPLTQCTREGGTHTPGTFTNDVTHEFHGREKAIWKSFILQVKNVYIFWFF